jgi:molybdopterin synthase sulfur carrier subunit
MDNSDLYKGLESQQQTHSVTLLYFARLREALGTAHEQLALPARVCDVAALREYLRQRGGVWAAELGEAKPIRIAVNQDMAAADTRIRQGDEIAFFPPVTGG